MKNKFTRNENNSAICYYRYSSAAQRDVSIEQQQEAAHKYAAENGLHIIKEYSDRAISGLNDDRPQFNLMLREAARLRPGYLIVWKTDRLSRDRLYSGIVKKHLSDFGVEIRYVAEPMPEDTKTRIILESLNEAMAQFYSINLSENITRGQRYNAQNAIFNGRKMFGYIGKSGEKYKIDEKTAPVVKRIFREYAEGVPMKTIMDELNATGITTSNGNRFTINSLRGILHNEAYTGLYRWGSIEVEDGIPRIISRELFDKVQKRFEKNKRGGRPASITQEDVAPDFWLTGHIYCGCCGNTINGISGTGKLKKTYYYYSCNSHRKSFCGKKNIRKEKLESLVFFILRELLEDDALIIHLADLVYAKYNEQNDNTDYIRSLQEQIKETEQKLSNLIIALEKGIFGETMQARMSELEKQKKLLKDELDAEQSKKEAMITPKQIITYMNTFKDKINDDKMRDWIVDTLIDAIYLFDDKLIVSFFFTKDREYGIKSTEDLMRRLDRIMYAMEHPPKGSQNTMDFFG